MIRFNSTMIGTDVGFLLKVSTYIVHGMLEVKFSHACHEHQIVVLTRSMY